MHSKIKIHHLKVGFTRPALIVQGEAAVLVDAGPPGKITELAGEILKHKVEFSQIKLIVLTHTHYDHTGTLKGLKALTGAPVAVHKLEADMLLKGTTPIPQGTNFFSKIIVSLGNHFKPGYAAPTPFKADIHVEDEFDLSPYGIEARVIHTPGHTEGSQSVIVGNRLISGDTFFNILQTTVFPPFANDPVQLLSTWQKLFDLGIKTIFPGHGSRFDVEKARKTWTRVHKKYRHHDNQRSSNVVVPMLLPSAKTSTV